MCIDHQYAGFLNSFQLWERDSLFDLSQFHMDVSNKSIPNNLSICIPENEVLGKRIEYFFEHYINNTNNYQVIAKGIQVFLNKTTIGELDFLIKDLEKNQVIHIEFIYKFYLYVPEIAATELQKWIGPNRKDSLVEKISKLKEKQLPLLYRHETAMILEELNIRPEDVLQRVSFFGNLFVPTSYQNKNIPSLNNKCIVGFWIHAKEFTEEKYGANLFTIPSKKNWMTHPVHAKNWASFSTIYKQIQISLSQKKSPLLWIKSSEDSFTKCFIVWW